MKSISLFSFSIISVFTTSAIFVFTTSAQNSTGLRLPKLEVNFDQIYVLKLAPDSSNKVLENWATNNHCSYWVDHKNGTICFSEITPQGETVKAWEYPIESFSEDNLTYTFISGKEGGTINIVVWKNNSMVALEGNDATFLVSGLKNMEK